MLGLGKVARPDLRRGDDQKRTVPTRSRKAGQAGDHHLGTGGNPFLHVVNRQHAPRGQDCGQARVLGIAVDLDRPQVNGALLTELARPYDDAQQRIDRLVERLPRPPYRRETLGALAQELEQLFDLEADPQELTNLTADPSHAGTLADLSAQADARWDLDAYDAEVRASQARRWVVYEALRNGAYYPWDFQPLRQASERYMRNHMDLNVLEENQRFPRGE